MEWDFIAPMVVAITLIVTVGAVVLLRPVAKQLAQLLELMVRDRQKGLPHEELARTRGALANLESRLALLEERQDFTDSLLTRGEPLLAHREPTRPGH